MTAELSYTDTRGYYGLRVQPSYDEMLKSLKNPIRIPQPDRSAKWYALGPYRAFLLEASKRFNERERQNLEYDDTGAHLPAAAARVGPMQGSDDVWDRQEQFNSNLDAEEARKLAEEAMAAEKKRQANETRKQQLSAYGPTSGHWTVEAHHKDLDYVGVPHAAPMPKMAMPAGQWQAPPTEYIAAGQPMAPEFPTYEQLNLGYSKTYKLGRPAALKENKNYQQLREQIL